MKPTVIMVGADKGGVGKTTTSRALLDYLARKNMPARAFDTENPRGTLKRFYPEITEVIDLNSVADQMKILDTLDSAAVKVTIVDLKAGNLSMALDTFDRIGVLEAARHGQFDLGLIHVVGPSVASLDEINEISNYIKGINYVIARNFINETNFFEWDEKTFKKYFADLPDATEIDIPKLNEMAYEQVDLAGVTFSGFVENKDARGADGNFSFVLRGYVRKWISDLDAEFGHLSLLQNLSRASSEPAAKPKAEPQRAAKK
ncbi:hypothetical protein [Hoeflea sp.]|uniref:hypothetical protein n=1 Tax=Hoeflea sp. TaxID=1940281 RepID=UPI003B011508